jgi:hypothetical protein
MTRWIISSKRDSVKTIKRLGHSGLRWRISYEIQQNQTPQHLFEAPDSDSLGWVKWWFSEWSPFEGPLIALGALIIAKKMDNPVTYLALIAILLTTVATL